MLWVLVLFALSDEPTFLSVKEGFSTQQECQSYLQSMPKADILTFGSCVKATIPGIKI